ncbi:MAG TPA: ribonuclease Y [Candidatus Kapabacteria bacterium]|nr:ribonuclease Y [Candidatus Kapabacteria bacterium]
MGITIIIISSVAGFFLALVIGHFSTRNLVKLKVGEAEQTAKNLLKDAENEAKNIKKEKVLEAKEEWHRRKQEFENEAQQRKNKMNEAEKLLKRKEDTLEHKSEQVNKKEKSLTDLEADVAKREKILNEKTKGIDKLVEEQEKKLEQIAGISKEDAKKMLVEKYTNDAKQHAAHQIRQIRDEAKLMANREAQNIIVQSIQRTASDHSAESTVSVVNLESDEMKGRIIGREGRNIRSFEAATGIDLIIDDTPEAVVISGFDPFRRQVAKVALEKLMLDGRIHPTRIEEVVEKTQKELEGELVNIGEQAILDLGIQSMHPDLLKIIGKMKYRTSYGQNLLNHSIEVAHLCSIMAAELGLDVNLAKRAGLLHDIGKCVEQDPSPHALIGYELAKKYKEKHVVCNAIGAHHEDIEMESPIAVLVQAADSISGARPGARRESLENYVKRLQKLEEIAMSFEGVSKTFAIQAGREIRVIVEPERVDDILADQTAFEIAQKIEGEMEYPGQIKVTVVRERRSVAIAK